MEVVLEDGVCGEQGAWEGEDKVGSEEVRLEKQGGEENEDGV